MGIFLLLVSETIQTSTWQMPIVTTSTCSNNEVIPAGRSPIIAWYFQNNLLDRFGVYNGSGRNNPAYGVGRNGCGKCLNLNMSLNQSVVVSATPYIDLRNISFSVESWINPTAVTDGLEHVIFGQCPALSNDQCMRSSIANPGVVYLLFRSDNQGGSHIIPNNTWSHVAYVYNLTARTMSLYLNGTLEGSGGNHGPFQGVPSAFEIGTIGIYTSSSLFFSGCIDEVSFYPFARTAAEIAATFALG
ncbi:unnamed protein product [Adineta steineri]|uniref:LamG-like jellyroll fold domain-containing protein n=1 Tax=Adineta steineri TaxID=433720 RepID=A0A819XNX2_9BILA|nr:unnamed protein product [Adineta steineri]CAF4144303.1 unnamed protein product [Adineta steineri]